MYVARFPLQVAGRKILPGEPVPEAASWQYSVLRAHLNLGWIEDVKESAPEAPALSAVTTVASGPSPEPTTNVVTSAEPTTNVVKSAEKSAEKKQGRKHRR